MKVAIIGYARDGQTALHYWSAQGADITVCDLREDVVVPEGIKSHLGVDYLKGLEGFDLIVRTSGLNPQLITGQSPGTNGKVTTVINEFMRVCPSKNIIGVTGTKGKSTTSTLIAKMLEAAGKQVVLGGNIGVPALELLPNVAPESWVVLEMSSYQLSDIQHSPHIGVCLMMAPEHLNWHENLPDYIAAKKNMFAHQQSSDIAIYYADNETSHEIASASPGKKIPYGAEPGAYIEDDKIVIDMQEICHVDELKLLGKHNQQNACAAVTAVWQVTKDVAALRSVLTTFTSLPHRLDFVREVDGVQYYNDSFASAPPAAGAALQAIPGKKVMIIGGFDRQLPLDELIATIQKYRNDIRALLLIGASAKRLAAELEQTDFTDYHLSNAKTMEEIIAQARELAQKGDKVVLSPGFPSFDMFKDFEERGMLFVKAVGAL
jgi:UDP-N-acetylmuramoylalanine--D-glutamate ligase